MKYYTSLIAMLIENSLATNRHRKVPIINMKQKEEFDNTRYMDLDTKICKARFSKDTYLETAVNFESEALLINKGEAWLNTFTLTVSYMLRCNYNVTSLLSDIAIKSVVAYVANYITKTPLKTHIMLKSIQQVFEHNT